MISELSQLYGFESLPELKVVTVGNGENRVFDSVEEQQQAELEEDAGCGEGYYQRYRYIQQLKEENVNQPMECREMVKVQLLFLKSKINEKVEHLKRNSQIFRELKSVLVDVERLIENF